MRWDRITATAPEYVGESHTGVTFVNVLFGIVVSVIVVGLAKDISDAVQDVSSLRETRLFHLGVGVVVTVGSWIGYHSSQHRPQLRIKFVNLPLWQFMLDVSMVFIYFLILQFAEQSRVSSAPILADVQQPTAFVADDARPEAVLVAIAFLLYVLWDYVSWRIKRDGEYSAALNLAPSPNEKFGPRRWVTLTFWVLTSGLAMGVLYTKPASSSWIIAIDTALIFLAVAYRLAKQLFDPAVTNRG